MYVLSLFCLITIVNFFTGIPAWNAPSMQMIEKEMGVIIQEYDKLYQTGFSWSRSGWGISMSLFLPLLFLFNKQNTKNFRKVILAFIFVLFSLFLCGNRSGLLGFIIACFLIFQNDEINYHFRKYKTKAYIIIAVLLIVFTSFVIKNLRLDADDISANRLNMFVYLPNLIQGIEFWGIGMGESKELLRRVGALDFQFHNTPINSIIEFGWLYGLSIVIIMISIFCQYLKRYKQDPQVAVYGAILISGIVTSMFEPAAIFGYLGGYCLWWFAYGIFVAKYKHSNIINYGKEGQQS